MTTTEVTAQLDETLATLAIDPSLPVPSFRELSALARTRQTPLRYVTVKTDDRVVACAVCVVEEGRIHGMRCRMYRLYNGKLHDYKLVYLAQAEDFAPLLRAVQQDARAQGADLVVFDGFVSTRPLSSLPGVAIDRIQTVNATRAPGGWKAIYGRKNIARLLKKYARRDTYAVRLTDVNEASIEALGRLHRERWGSEDIASPFTSPQRVADYLVHPANKIVMQLLYEGEVLAVHYGMRYGKTLLWHTPVINIKYLDDSPLRLLLAETARYCEQEDLDCLDLGLGDEAYKTRFVNDHREIGTLYIGITARGRLHNGVCRILDPTRIKQAILDGQAALRTAAARAAAWVNTVNEYELEGPPNGATPGPDPHFHAFATYHDFVDFMRANRQQVLKAHYRMFKANDALYLLTGTDGIVAWGCGRTRQSVQVDAINRPIATEGRRVVAGLEITGDTDYAAGTYARLVNGILGDADTGPVRLLAAARDRALNDAVVRTGGTRVATHTHRHTRHQTNAG